MRRILTVLAALVVIMAFAAPALADPPPPDNDKCATIQGGTITDSANNPLTVGFDEFGYNYQAHLFVGTYASSDRISGNGYWGDMTSDYVDDMLIMKWSQDWLANVDCDEDGKLDRGTSGISLGWLTNHVTSVGDEPHTEYFVKIVYVGAGGSLWGVYDIVLEVWNDPANGDTGLYFKAGAPGFGLNDHWTD